MQEKEILPVLSDVQRQLQQATLPTLQQMACCLLVTRIVLATKAATMHSYDEILASPRSS